MKTKKSEKSGKSTIRKSKKARNWSWKEPTDEEFEKRRKSENFYKIYHVVEIEGKEEDITDYKFWAKTDEDALNVLERWKNELGSKGCEYYYSTSGYYTNGSGKRFDSSADMFKDYKRRRGISFVLENTWHKTFGKIPDLWFRLKEALRRAFLGHSSSESWDLWSHVLEDLKYNLPIMRDNMNSYPSGLDMDKWKAILDELVLHVNLYMFYDSYGIIDESDPSEVEFKQKWDWSIPRKPGTRGEINYARLQRLSEREWNGIMRILKKWGRSLWD